MMFEPQRKKPAALTKSQARHAAFALQMDMFGLFSMSFSGRRWAATLRKWEVLMHSQMYERTTIAAILDNDAL